MSVTGQPYSDSALSHAKGILEGKLLTGWQELEMGAAAMHDRKALGLEASVHAASYRQEVIQEVVGRLRSQQRATESVVGLDTAASLIAHWFGFPGSEADGAIDGQ